MVIGYSLNSSVYILTPSLEKEHDLRYILRVMGCKSVPYWLGTFSFDFLAFSSTLLVFVISIYI
jgi:ATP-binding cassette, subfamily A (ABC1), member 3